MFSQEIDSKIKKISLIVLTCVGVAFVIGFFGFHNRVTDVGYRPTQPVPFSHKIHSGVNGIKCMYCHTSVETSAHSPVPSTSTCMNCHIAVKADSPQLKLIRESNENNTPVAWKRVHYLPDYVHFDHSRHIRSQIDCASCHGKVETMGVVSQFKPMNMGFCLDCHRNPVANIIPARPISGIFTGIKATAYDSTAQAILANNIEPTTNPQFGSFMSDIPKQEVEGIPTPKHPGIGPENCSTCHH